MNKSVKKCCICNNEKIGEFITINDKKYHLCCIEQLESNWNELKKWLEAYFEGMTIKDIPVDDLYKKGLYRMNEYTLELMQELESNNE